MHDHGKQKRVEIEEVCAYITIGNTRYYKCFQTSVMLLRNLDAKLYKPKIVSR